MARVLFVDSSTTAVRRAQKLYGKLGDIDAAYDMPEALEKIAANNYDLFMLAHKLQTGSGIELSRAIRGMEIYEKTPILLFTHDRRNQLLYAAMDAGVNYCFEKTSLPETVVETALKQIEEPSFDKVELEYLETKCLQWRLGNVFYQYSPEFGVTSSGLSREDAHQRMAELLLEAYKTKQRIYVFSEEIDLAYHCLKL